MKNLKNLTALMIISSILFFSCGSNKSLTQRHYNNRYYIGMSKGNKDESIAKVEESAPVIQASESNQALEGSVPAGTVLAPAETVQPIQSDLPVVSTPEMSVSTNFEAENDRVKNTGFSDRTNGSGSRKHSIGQNKKIQPEKITMSSPEGDALSLLWIIIIILLILWALGIIVGGFGLGGIIHVLLVIALILLILWLLRII